MQRSDLEPVLDSSAAGLCAMQKMQMEEECQNLLQMLVRDEVKQVALLKVEGYTNEEIAEMLDCTRRTVQRRLDFIRSVWSRKLSKP